jgi:hypothetical protein
MLSSFAICFVCWAMSFLSFLRICIEGEVLFGPYRLLSFHDQSIQLIELADNSLSLYRRSIRTWLRVSKSPSNSLSGSVENIIWANEPIPQAPSYQTERKEDGPSSSASLVILFESILVFSAPRSHVDVPGMHPLSSSGRSLENCRRQTVETDEAMTGTTYTTIANKLAYVWETNPTFRRIRSER